MAIAIFLCYIGATAQNAIDSLFAAHPEVVFSFEESDASKLRELSRIVSIDKRKGNTVTAYANRTEFEAFLQKGYDYTIVRRNAEKAVSQETCRLPGTGKVVFPDHEGLIVYHAPVLGRSLHAVSLPFGKELFSCRGFR